MFELYKHLLYIQVLSCYTIVPWNLHNCRNKVMVLLLSVFEHTDSDTHTKMLCLNL